MATKKKIVKNKKKIAKKKVTKKAVRPKARKAAPKKKAKKVVKKAAKKIVMSKPIGRVTHFYTSIKVAIIKFSHPAKQGTTVLFKGATTDFKQKLDSMQFNHKPVTKALKGKQMGLKVKSRVREGDEVFLA